MADHPVVRPACSGFTCSHVRAAVWRTTRSGGTDTPGWGARSQLLSRCHQPHSRPMRLRVTALAVALCGGCGAQLLDGLDPSVSGVDSTPDASTDPIGDPPPPAPRCASRSVYLNFEGQMLTRGPSDATLNQASWMTIDQGTAPPYQSGNPDRATVLKTITDGVRAQLSQSRSPSRPPGRPPATT